MLKYHYIFPYAIAVILAFLLFRSCGKVDTLQDTLKQREALELSEKFWQDKADSLSKNIKVRIDTLYITRTKLKTRNDTIYISQGKVGNLNADSSFIFFSKYTGATVIRD